MPDITLQDAHNAFTELKSQLESRLPDLDKVSRLEKALDEYQTSWEAKAKEHTKQISDMEANQRALIERAGSANGAKSADDQRKEPEYKSFFDFATKGILPERSEKALLRSDSDIAGGVLVPTVVEREIIKNITESSPVRRYARVIRTTAKSVSVPRRLNNLVALYEGEAETGASDNQEYGADTITTHRMTLTVPMTLDLMLGAPQDMEQEIVADCTEAFGQAEGRNFTAGDGVKKPKGFANDSRVISTLTAASGTLALDDLVNVSGELKVGYNPMYFMNRRTMAFLRRQKTTQGEYLWSPAIAEAAGPTFNGYQYDAGFIDLDSHDTGVGSIPVVFGDLGMAYRIYDRLGITFIRDELTRKKEAVIEWTFYMFNDGRVVKPEALKVIKIKP